MGREPDGRWALAASVFTPASGAAVQSAQEAAKPAARYGAFRDRHTRCPPATYSRGRPPGRDWVPPRLLSAYWPRQVLVTALSRPFAHAPVPLASKVLRWVKWNELHDPSFQYGKASRNTLSSLSQGHWEGNRSELTWPGPYRRHTHSL